MSNGGRTEAALWGWLWCDHCHWTAKLFHKRKVAYDLCPMEERENRQMVYEETGTIIAPMVEFYADGDVLVYPPKSAYPNEDERWRAWEKMLETKFGELGLGEAKAA